MSETLLERILNHKSLYAIGILIVAALLRYLNITPAMLGEYVALFEVAGALLAGGLINQPNQPVLRAGRGGGPPR